MTRVTVAVPRRKRHKKILKAARGYFGGRRRLYRVAKNAVERAWQYNYRDRRQRRRDFRRLWITRLNAAAREHGISYNTLIKALKDKQILIDRKILSDLAIRRPTTFAQILNVAIGGSTN